MNEADRKARDRFAMLMGLRAGGAALMLLGLYALLGGSIGGEYGIGGVLVAVGMLGLVVVPQILVRRWRTPK
jgi:hypothetical protein